MCFYAVKKYSNQTERMNKWIQAYVSEPIFILDSLWKSKYGILSEIFKKAKFGLSAILLENGQSFDSAIWTYSLTPLLNSLKFTLFFGSTQNNFLDTSIFDPWNTI